MVKVDGDSCFLEGHCPVVEAESQDGGLGVEHRQLPVPQMEEGKLDLIPAWDLESQLPKLVAGRHCRPEVLCDVDITVFLEESSLGCEDIERFNRVL